MLLRFSMQRFPKKRLPTTLLVGRLATRHCHCKTRSSGLRHDSSPKNSPRGYADGRFSPLGEFRSQLVNGKVVGRPHKGTDVLGPEGTSVRAMLSGTVVFNGNKTGFGEHTVITRGTSGGQTYDLLYGHMSSTSVAVGKQIEAGDMIGVVGQDGLATGIPHLHIEVATGVWGRNTPREDPVEWLSNPPSITFDFSKP